MSSPNPNVTRIIDVHCGWGATPTASHWNDLNNIRRDLTERSIEQAFISSLLSRRYDLPAGNDALGGALAIPAEAGTTELKGWLVIHPARLSDSNAQMRKHLFEDAFIGAALYPDPYSNAPVSLRDARELLTSFRRYAKPILVEARTADAMAQVVALAEELGSTRVIASGMGGDEWREAIAMTVKPLNLFLDISGALVPEKIEFAINVLGGTRKLLFASGAPQTDPAAVLGMLDDLSLSDDERHRILHDNAMRLFRLGGISDGPVSLSPMPGASGAADPPRDAPPGLSRLQ